MCLEYTKTANEGFLTWSELPPLLASFCFNPIKTGHLIYEYQQSIEINKNHQKFQLIYDVYNNFKSIFTIICIYIYLESMNVLLFLLLFAVVFFFNNKIVTIIRKYQYLTAIRLLIHDAVIHPC